MRITLVIYSLGGGGAERVMSVMANYWIAKGWRVTLLTYEDGGVPPAYDLDKAVLLRQLGIAGRSIGPVQAVVSNLKRLRVLRRAIKDSSPQAVVSFLDTINVRTLLASLGLGVPVIVSEHIDPAYHPIAWAWSALRRICYPWATGVVTLTEDALSYFSATVRNRGYVIPNPVSVPDEYRCLDLMSRDKVVLGMGRLSYQKGFDQLLRAFAIVSDKHAVWSLVIWGEGPLRAELEELSDELGLRGRVSFPGWTADPFHEMSRAGLFVLSSRYEGFGMVLAEAMACGLAVVSFDCPSGPRDIVRHNSDGLLVPRGNVAALAAAMDRLLSDKEERNRLGTRAVEVTNRYNKENVMGMWESMLRKAVSSRPRKKEQR